nr:hypothetical protein CIT39_18215 [Bradyrhizobium symbiodeficiens]
MAHRPESHLDSVAGLSAWSDQQIKRAIAQGIGCDGYKVVPASRVDRVGTLRLADLYPLLLRRPILTRR